MRILPLLTLLFAWPCFAEAPLGAHAHWERLQRMVKVGVITPEGAKQEQEQVQASERATTGRKAAQRGLASVQPELHPLKTKHLKLAPMEVFLD